MFVVIQCSSVPLHPPYGICTQRSKLCYVLQMGLFMAALVLLLDRPGMVRSAVVQFRLVELLLTMISPQLDTRRANVGGALGRGYSRPGEQVQCC